MELIPSLTTENSNYKTSLKSMPTIFLLFEPKWPMFSVTGHPHDTFHHNPPQSAICLQYVCNMSAICLQYLQYPQPLPSPQNSTNFHCNPNPSMHSTVLILCLFTKQPSQRYKPFFPISYFL